MKYPGPKALLSKLGIKQESWFHFSGTDKNMLRRSNLLEKGFIGLQFQATVHHWGKSRQQESEAISHIYSRERRKNNHSFPFFYSAHFLYSLLTQSRQSPYRHAHRPTPCRQLLIETLFLGGSRLGQLDKTSHHSQEYSGLCKISPQVLATRRKAEDGEIKEKIRKGKEGRF